MVVLPCYVSPTDMVGTTIAKWKTVRYLNLGHQFTPFAPYGDREYAYCENPSCKARLIIQGDRAEGHALFHACPVLEGDGKNGEVTPNRPCCTIPL